jgi:signal transduction histidine kinase
MTLYFSGLILGTSGLVTLAALFSAKRLSKPGLAVAGMVFVLTVGLSIAAARALVRRSLAPLNEITFAARQASTDALERRLNYVGPRDELAELAETLDAMLDRLAVTFASQKRFVANASHELRTPLAVMRTEIDVTLADPHASVAELRRMAAVVRSASERANQLVESLLLLARTEVQAGRRLAKREQVDLSDGVRSSLRAMERQVAQLNLQVATQLSSTIVVGDPVLLERLAGNLIENATRYNMLYGHVWVRTYAVNNHAYLQVANTGPELDAAEIPGLFEPFSRGGFERTGTRGSGLGLSIVAAVVDAHGGRVDARPRQDGGLEITAMLPLS